MTLGSLDRWPVRRIRWPYGGTGNTVKVLAIDGDDATVEATRPWGMRLSIGEKTTTTYRTTVPVSFS